MIAVKKSRAASTDRSPAVPNPAKEAQTETLVAPVRGWVEGASTLSQDAVLWAAENVFITTRGVRVRGGSYKVATIGSAVKSVFSYTSSGAEEMFAASTTDIYNISALDPVSVPAADVSSQTVGLYSTSQMGTVAGQYLYAVNGADFAQLYDGTTWAQITDVSTPAITGVATSSLKYVWTHKNRVWFIEANSNSAWYLPVDSIGGAAGEFSLDGVFQNGGHLLFGATWSQDSGDGMDDRIVFVSNLGEVAVYAGTNPASATDWGIVGLYKMPTPLGQDAHIKAGGDVVFATDGGLFPLSEVISKDPAALELSAISAQIESSWRAEGRLYSDSAPWQVVKWAREDMIVVSMPTSASVNFVANVSTGAWSKYTGWDMQCATIYNQSLFFGAGTGFIYQAERGGSDDGQPYTSKWAYSPQYLGVGAAVKVGNGLNAKFSAANEFTPQLSMQSDYNVNFPTAPAAANDPPAASGVWDVGLWDVATWDSPTLNPAEAPIITTGWQAQGAVGATLVPQFQITTDSENRPNIEFLSVDVLFEIGMPIG